MSNVTFEAILTTSGWETTIALDIGQIGVQLSDGSLGWSTCRLDEWSGLNNLLLGAAVEGVVKPALLGQPLSDLPGLLARIDNLTERVAVAVKRPSSDPGRARRNFLQSLVGNEPEPPPEELEEVVQPLSLHLRLAVQSAALQAVAQSKGLPLAVLLAQTFGLGQPVAGAPLQVSMGEADTAVFHLVQRRIGALQVTVPEETKNELMQLNATKFVTYLRRLQEWVSAQSPRGYVPRFHLDLRGGLGEIYADHAGRILGVLYNLEQSAASFGLRVQDPVLLETFEDYVTMMAKLRSYVDKRHLRLRLTAGSWLDSVEAVAAIIEAEAAHTVALDVGWLGGLANLVTAVRLCQEKRIPFVLLDEANLLDERLMVGLALATQPVALGCEVKTAVSLHNQMQRSLLLLQGNTPSILPPAKLG